MLKRKLEAPLLILGIQTASVWSGRDCSELMISLLFIYFLSKKKKCIHLVITAKNQNKDWNNKKHWEFGEGGRIEN
jgi:hypothetical protein